jgi:hypothetical protein
LKYTQLTCSKNDEKSIREGGPQVKQEPQFFFQATRIKRENVDEDDNNEGCRIENGNKKGRARRRRRRFAGKVTIDLTVDDEEGREYIPIE